MNPKENLEQNQWFPKLELLPEFQEITSLTKDAITVATNDEKPKESPVNFKDYLDKLFWNRENRENRTGFPKEIYTSMFALKDLFEKIFIQKIDTPVEASKDIWTQVWGWRIR